VIAAVGRADGLVVASPIFSASYSGLFKMFFDVLEKDALAGKPVIIAATAGTARHSLALEYALRPLLAYHQAIVIPTSVFAATEDWGTAGADRALATRIERAAGELAKHVDCGRASAPPDPYDDVVPFDQLLSRP
jgi:FMN reductase